MSDPNPNLDPNPNPMLSGQVESESEKKTARIRITDYRNIFSFGFVLDCSTLFQRNSDSKWQI
jgi:hypothetical protein